MNRGQARRHGLRAARERYENVRSRGIPLDRVLGFVDRTGGRPWKPLCPWRVEGRLPPGLELLVSTGSQGVLHLRDGSLHRRVSGKAFGITRLRDRWVAFRRTGLHGTIVTVPLDDRSRPRTLVWGLSTGVHQIDAVDDHLVIVDTYANRIVRMPADTPWPTSWRRAQATYVGGEARRGRHSDNYRHFNSLFARDGQLHLVAHNDWAWTHRSSEVWTLDTASMETVSIRDLDARAAHNFWTDGERTLWCDSLRGQLVQDFEPVFEEDGFTRGLSVADDLIVVGSSDVQGRQAERDASDGRIHLLTPDFERLATIHLGGAPVQDIRRLDGPDLALSDRGRPR